ncbi:hypothetical protein WDW89_21695 [Deltaproteobacteria bacterium TL4]
MIKQTLSTLIHTARTGLCQLPPQQPKGEDAFTADYCSEWDVRTLILPITGHAELKLLLLNLWLGPTGIAGFDDQMCSSPLNSKGYLVLMLLGKPLPLQVTLNFTKHDYTVHQACLEFHGSFDYALKGAWPNYSLHCKIAAHELSFDFGISAFLTHWWSKMGRHYRHYSTFGKCLGRLEYQGTSL